MNSEFISFTERLDRCWMEGRFSDLETFLAKDVVFVAPGGEHRSEGLAQAVEGYRQFMSHAQVNRFETNDHVVTLKGRYCLDGRWRRHSCLPGRDSSRPFRAGHA